MLVDSTLLDPTPAPAWELEVAAAEGAAAVELPCPATNVELPPAVVANDAGSVDTPATDVECDDDDLLLFLCACVPPTAPPTAAPIMTSARMTSPMMPARVLYHGALDLETAGGGRGEYSLFRGAKATVPAPVASASRALFGLGCTERERAGAAPAGRAAAFGLLVVL